MRWEALRDLLLEVRQRYDPSVLVIEDNTIKNLRDGASYQSLVSAYGGNVIPHTTHRNKDDATYGFYAMGRLFELGLVRIPYSGKQTQEIAHQLIDEALGNLTTTDVVMSLWFAFNRTYALKKYIPGALPTRFNRGSFDLHRGTWRGWEGGTEPKSWTGWGSR